MEAERFKKLLDELDGNSLQTMKEKNARYAQNGDCLHNFRSGADIAGGTPAQACWGYVTKHLVALRDMVERDDFSNREDFLEKCQDTINYIRFLWCIGNDNVSMYMPKPEEPILLRMPCITMDPINVVVDGVAFEEFIQKQLDDKEKENGMHISQPKPECEYADYVHPYGDRVCLGTREKDLCLGYAKCDSYKPKENKEKEND